MRIVTSPVPKRAPPKVFENGRLYALRKDWGIRNINEILLMTPNGMVTLPTCNTMVPTRNCALSVYVDVTDEFELRQIKPA